MNLIDKLTPDESKEVLRHIIGAGLVTEGRIRQTMQRALAKAQQFASKFIEGDGQGAQQTARPAGSPLAQKAVAAKVAQASAPKSAAAKTVATSAKSAGSKSLTRADGSASSSVSAEQLASRQLQGKYLALIRQIPKTKRNAFKHVSETKGREAAIRAMQKYVKDGTMPGGGAATHTAQKKVTAKPKTKPVAKTAVSKKAVQKAAAPKKVSRRPVVEDEPDVDNLDDLDSSIDEVSIDDEL